jgi:ATP-binding cassette subfamily F protein 3
VQLGHNVVVGYYAQHHADVLDGSRTVLEEIRAVAPDRPEAYVRGILGAFLFSGDDVDKRVGVLSGGERARVALARLLLRPANLLLLDEPTNHLDLDSSEALIQALRSYEGTLLFVSHNRSFLGALATQVWEVRDGGVNAFPGTLDEYLYHLEQVASADPSAPPAAAGAVAAPAKLSDKERKRLEAEARQRRSALQAPIKKEIARIESRIAELEAALKEAETVLADPAVYADFARARPHVETQASAKAELEPLYAAWEEAQGRLAATETDAAEG